LKKLPPHTAQLLKRYDQQIEPEARFVRFVDKVLPAIINTITGDANTFKEDYGISNIQELNSGREARTAKLQTMFPEFQFIHVVRDLIAKTCAEHIFRKDV
jgi:hypothetical protein